MTRRAVALLLGLVVAGCQASTPPATVPLSAFEEAVQRAESWEKWARLYERRLMSICGRFYTPTIATAPQTNSDDDIARSRQIVATPEWFRACNNLWTVR